MILFYICIGMEKFTQEQAIQEIFNNNETPLTPLMLVQKHRYKNGTLSQKAIDAILKENGYEVIQEALYTKK